MEGLLKAEQGLFLGDVNRYSLSTSYAPTHSVFTPTGHFEPLHKAESAEAEKGRAQQWPSLRTHGQDSNSESPGPHSSRVRRNPEGKSVAVVSLWEPFLLSIFQIFSNANNYFWTTFII